VFYLTLGDIEKEVFLLDISKKTSVSAAQDRLLDIMAELASGKAYSEFGTKVDDIVKVFHTQPTVNASNIRGTVVYIDSFENVILNIKKELFESVRNNRPFSVFLHGHEEHLFKNVNTHYDEAEESELVVLFNDKGNMEISLNRANAAGLLGLKLFDTVRIEFREIGSR
jgi:S-adenosyl-L-methionine hydrolase (adenosine-forming)